MSSPEDPKGAGAPSIEVVRAAAANVVEQGRRRFGGGKEPPPPGSGDEEDEEDDGMLRMSFLEHLEELRSRLIKAIIGVGVAFTLSLTFCQPLWTFVSKPAVEALRSLGINPPELVMITPMESFQVI